MVASISVPEPGAFTSQYQTPDISPTLPVFITEGPDGAVWFSEAGVNKIGSATMAAELQRWRFHGIGCRPFP